MFTLATYNVAEGGEEIYNPAQIIHNIKDFNPDILCMQEGISLNNYSYRAKIEGIPGSFKNITYSNYPIKYIIKPFVIIEVKNKLIAVANVHFNDEPYQPFQYYKVKYGNWDFLDCRSFHKCQTEIYNNANLARGRDLEFLLRQLDIVIDITPHIIIAGDFNEPSSQDSIFDFPTTKTLFEYGFQDLVAPYDRRRTWDHTKYPERIDFILGKEVICTEACVGRSWPSDHHMINSWLRV